MLLGVCGVGPAKIPAYDGPYGLLPGPMTTTRGLFGQPKVQLYVLSMRARLCAMSVFDDPSASRVLRVVLDGRKLLLV